LPLNSIGGCAGRFAAAHHKLSAVRLSAHNSSFPTLASSPSYPSHSSSSHHPLPCIFTSHQSWLLMS
jgi:hypothetical protein